MSLMFAASNGHAQVTAMLLERGADPDQREESLGWTALIWAAKEGRSDAVQTLLDYGADASLRDFDGRSAADWAMERGHDEVLSLLLKRSPAAGLGNAARSLEAAASPRIGARVLCVPGSTTCSS
jgi:ankyrin repeat protein